MAKPKRQRALRPARVFKNKKARAQQSTHFFRLLFVFFILFFIIIAIGTYFFRHKLSLLSFEVPSFGQHYSPVNNPVTRLKISSAHIDLTIQSVKVAGKNWPKFNDSATHIANSAQPLGGGNIILYAANSPGLFQTLDQVKIGDVVVLYVKDGKSYEYLVKEVGTVSPHENANLLPTQSEVVTLFTSSGIFNSKRLVVRAIPIRVPSF